MQIDFIIDGANVSVFNTVLYAFLYFCEFN